MNTGSIIKDIQKWYKKSKKNQSYVHKDCTDDKYDRTVAATETPDVFMISDINITENRSKSILVRMYNGRSSFAYYDKSDQPYIVESQRTKSGDYECTKWFAVKHETHHFSMECVYLNDILRYRRYYMTCYDYIGHPYCWKITNIPSDYKSEPASTEFYEDGVQIRRREHVKAVYRYHRMVGIPHMDGENPAIEEFWPSGVIQQQHYIRDGMYFRERNLPSRIVYTKQKTIMLAEHLTCDYRDADMLFLTPLNDYICDLCQSSISNTWCLHRIWCKEKNSYLDWFYSKKINCLYCNKLFLCNLKDSLFFNKN